MGRYACLPCRRGFGRTGTKHCPACGRPLTPMGWAFKALRREDTEQWHKVELLVRAGVRFDGNRNYPPLETVHDAESFLAACREASEVRRRKRVDAQKAQKLRLKRRELRRRKLERRGAAQRAATE